MEHEETYTLMMDALDGELAETRRSDLELHLRACPTCMQEWQALLAIETLFRQTPALSPAVDFAERTLARLPNRKYRVWTIAAMYMLLLFAGTLPVLIGFWAVSNLGRWLSQPALLRGIGQSVDKVYQVAATIFSALLSGAGEFVLQQPAIIGWLFVMIGVVSLWSGIYQQALRPMPQRQP